MKATSFFVLLSALLFTGCKKSGTASDNCDKIKNATITFNGPVTIGDPLHFSVPDLGDNIYYSWYGPDNFDSYFPSHDISYAELKHEGWYYISISNNDCASKSDSVYIDVKLKQGNPSCSVANNTARYSNMGDDSFSYLWKGIESTYGLLSLEGSGVGNLTVYFHPEWRDREPEDGIYTTINTPLFGQIDANYNKVFVTSTKQSIYWGSYENQEVYVSHVNGKLQVRFCNLSMGGNNGNSYTTSASGNILED